MQPTEDKMEKVHVNRFSVRINFSDLKQSPEVKVANKCQNYEIKSNNYNIINNYDIITMMFYVIKVITMT